MVLINKQKQMSNFNYCAFFRKDGNLQDFDEEKRAGHRPSKKSEDKTEKKKSILVFLLCSINNQDFGRVHMETKFSGYCNVRLIDL